MWNNIKDILGKSAPLLGGVLGGPVGAGVGGLIANALGVEETPQAIEKELKSNPDAILKLKQLEQDHKHKLEELKLEELKLKQQKYDTAHETYRQNSTVSNKIATQVIKYNLPVIALLVIANIVIVDIFKENAPLIAIASNVIGLAIGNLFAERQAIINFFFGSSIGSKEKDEKIKSKG